MRRSFVYVLLIVAIATISGAYLVSRNKSPRSGPELSARGQQSAKNSRTLAMSAPDSAVSAARSQTATSTAETPSGSPAAATQNVAVGQAGTQRTISRAEKQRAEHEAAATARADELMDLAMSDDPAALKNIVAELNNGDPDIRRAAVEATVQYGDSNAIPWLEAAAQWAQTTDEKTEINDAIDFLKLPKLENRTEGRPVARPKTITTRK